MNKKEINEAIRCHVRQEDHPVDIMSSIDFYFDCPSCGHETVAAKSIITEYSPFNRTCRGCGKSFVCIQETTYREYKEEKGT